MREMSRMGTKMPMAESMIRPRPGAEHVVERAHVVGRTRHDVADALPAVEGLALAQQADVEFLAAVALDALRQELDRAGAQQRPSDPGQAYTR